MKILLIRPRPDKETIGLQNVMVCEPLELEYICSYIQDLKHEIDIIDLILESKKLDYFIKKHRPDLVAFTSYIAHVNVIKKYAKTVKEINSKIITVVGGVHAEVLPEDFIDPYIDYIIRANGLKTFRSLVISLSNNVKSYIPGLFENNVNKKYEKDTVFNYPFPDRDKVSKYRKHYYYMFHQNCALIKTSFGCPYKCEFCFCRQITDDRYFCRDMENVIRELKTIPQTEIYIVDDNFLFNKDKLNKFCDLLEQENIHKKYLVYGRADFIANNEDAIARLKKNGLRAVIVGLESYKDNDLTSYHKNSSITINEQAVAILKKYDIECYGTFILGLDWDKSDFNGLAKWIKRLGITFVNLQPFTPLKGTPMFDQYKDDLIVPVTEYEKWDLAHLVVKPTKISVRKYYWYTILLYYKTMVNFKKSIYMMKKYGIIPTLKLSYGAFKVNLQYFKRLLEG